MAACQTRGPSAWAALAEGPWAQRPPQARSELACKHGRGSFLRRSAFGPRRATACSCFAGPEEAVFYVAQRALGWASGALFALWRGLGLGPRARTTDAGALLQPCDAGAHLELDTL
eukprot:8548289-Alexandrium_andersonii.AAC.1